MENGSGAGAPHADAQGSAETAAFGITIVNRPARTAHRGLKVVVFNARSGARFQGILACLRRPPLADADVIMLCEADWQLRRSFGREIAADLATALGMSFAYGPEFVVRQPPNVPPAFLGNAILSSAPLGEPRMIELPTSARMIRRVARLIGQPRALVTSATFGGRPITIAVAHLHSRWNPAGRARQLAPLLEHLAPLDGARQSEGSNAASGVILGGDFNTTTTDLYAPWGLAMVAARMAARPWRFRYPEAYEPLFAELARAGFEVRGANVPGKPTFTFNRAIPPALRPKLDWIALRGLAAIPGSARVVAARDSFFGSRVSDHDFVMCEVQL